MNVLLHEGGAPLAGKTWAMPHALAHRWTRVDGRRMHGYAGGPDDGRTPLILIHGFVLAGPIWLPVAEQLAGRYRVLIPDFPGFGQSEGPPRSLDVPGMADVLRDWMDANHVARATLVGNSMGTQIAVEFAVRFPDRVETLILQGPTVDPRARSILGQLIVMERNRLREDSPELSVLATTEGKLAGWKRSIATGRALLRDRIETKLPRVRVPTLVTRGMRDPVVNSRWAHEVRALLPRGWLIEIPEATHSIVYVDAYRFVAAIRPFLERQPPYGSSPSAR